MHLAATGNTVLSDLLLHIFELVFTQGDADRMCAVLLYGAKHQSAPTTTDIEQTIPRLQSELAADVVDFLFLRQIEAILWFTEIGAGINPLPIQPQRKKLVRYIIVASDRTPVEQPRMPPPFPAITVALFEANLLRATDSYREIRNVVNVGFKK